MNKVEVVKLKSFDLGLVVIGGKVANVFVEPVELVKILVVYASAEDVPIVVFDSNEEVWYLKSISSTVLDLGMEFQETVVDSVAIFVDIVVPRKSVLVLDVVWGLYVIVVERIEGGKVVDSKNCVRTFFDIVLGVGLRSITGLV